MRSRRQRDVLLQMVAGGKLQVLNARQFGAVTGDINGQRVDGRTLNALEAKGLIEPGKETSPWTRNMKLTKAGRTVVR